MSPHLTQLEPRGYQTRAVDWAMDRNEAVVCLPTGTGKTLVGGLWACHVLEEPAIERVLVIEPSRFLVEQVHAYLQEQTTMDVTKLYGSTTPEQRRHRWDEGSVVVTTPQTAVNDIDALAFDALLIDECHHTSGRHAFAQLVRRYAFDRTLGLSATIPRRKASEIEELIGEIRRRAWQDLPDEHVPEWRGDVYDTAYPGAYEVVLGRLEQYRRELDGTRLAGLPTLGIRMLSRDGALALEETLEAETCMGELMGAETLPLLDDCAPLHKLEACRAALADHEFEKAVLFVERVAVAERLAEELEEYRTVTVLGRRHALTSGQQQAVRQARAEETEIIIATSAGEEGMDLPRADLLIVWSNTVRSVRFIQRLGRVMRQSESAQPKVAVYLATPDSPDYESLRLGIGRAEQAGLDVHNIDHDLAFSGSIANRVVDAVAGTTLQRDSIIETLGQPASKVDEWLQTALDVQELFYLYAVPADLDEWRKTKRGLEERFEIPILTKNLSPGKPARYYARPTELGLVRTELPSLFETSNDPRLKISFGPSHERRSAYSAYNTPEVAKERMLDELSDDPGFAASVTHNSRSPKFSFEIYYQGPATPDVLRAVTENASAIATEVSHRLD